MGAAGVDLDAGVPAEAGMLVDLTSLVPGDAAPKGLGQRLDSARRFILQSQAGSNLDAGKGWGRRRTTFIRRRPNCGPGIERVPGGELD